MNKAALIILSVIAGVTFLSGCSDSTALTAKEKANIGGGDPPKDVWDKVGEAQKNQPDRSKDYGTIPGQSTTAAANAQTPGPSAGSGR